MRRAAAWSCAACCWRCASSSAACRTASAACACSRLATPGSGGASSHHQRAAQAAHLAPERRAHSPPPVKSLDGCGSEPSVVRYYHELQLILIRRSLFCRWQNAATRHACAAGWRRNHHPCGLHGGSLAPHARGGTVARPSQMQVKGGAHAAPRAPEQKPRHPPGRSSTCRSSSSDTASHSYPSAPRHSRTHPNVQSHGTCLPPVPTGCLHTQARRVSLPAQFCVVTRGAAWCSSATATGDVGTCDAGLLATAGSSLAPPAMHQCLLPRVGSPGQGAHKKEIKWDESNTAVASYSCRLPPGAHKCGAPREKCQEGAGAQPQAWVRPAPKGQQPDKTQPVGRLHGVTVNSAASSCMILAVKIRAVPWQAAHGAYPAAKGAAGRLRPASDPASPR